MHLVNMLEKLSPLSKKRILITGGNGMLGYSFSQQIKKHLPLCEVRTLGKEDLDVRNAESVLKWQEWIRNGWIVHCAAFVNVEGCSQNPTLARDTIVGGTENLVGLASLSGARIFYPQSFLIYDGDGGLISEENQPNPLSLYGQLKYEAERIILQNTKQSLIVRMAGFFGGYQRDKNFVGKIIKHIHRLIESGQSEVKIGDRTWQPTWTDDLALNSLLLMAQEEVGTFQMACHGAASFYQLTEEIVQNLGWGDKIDVIPVSEREISSTELGRRPTKAEFNCQRLISKNMDIQRPWRQSLREYLQDSYFYQYKTVSNSVKGKMDELERYSSQ